MAIVALSTAITTSSEMEDELNNISDTSYEVVDLVESGNLDEAISDIQTMRDNLTIIEAYIDSKRRQS